MLKTADEKDLSIEEQKEEIVIQVEEEIDQEELKIIRSNPYDYIKNYFEELFPYMGGRVMEVLSLVPGSLVLPRFRDVNGKETIARISYLLLSPPGTGKTSLSNYFSDFCLNPFQFEYITDSKLSSVLNKLNKVTIISSDVARIFRDPFLAKLVENIIGDEGKLSRFTQRTKSVEEKKIDAVSYFAGTPANLYSTISDGLIFRVCPHIVFHSEKEHEEILKRINNMIGNSNGNKIKRKEKVIKYYYQMLYKIQEGKGEINPIEGYVIPDYFRQEIEEKLIPLFVKSYENTNFEFNRELNQCYKYMVSHAFLNLFNRRITEGKMVLEDADLRVALNLSEKEIKIKTVILQCINMISERRLKTLMDLDLYLKSYEKNGRKFPEIYYKILQTIIRNR